jgi:translocation and assembly module TamB
LRKWLIGAFYVVLAAIGLLAAVATLAGSRAARDYAREKAREAIRRELGLVADIDDVYIDPYRFLIVARGITLDHPTHGRLVSANLLRIRPSPLALLRGRVKLNTIDIEQADLTLVVRDGQVVNLPRLSDTSPDSSQLKLPFRRLSVRQARVIVDARPVVRAEFPRIDLEIVGSRRGVSKVSLLSLQGYIDHPSGRERIKRLEVKGDLDAKGARVQLLRILTPDLQFTIRRAQIGWPLGTSYSGDVVVAVNLSRIAQWPHGFTLPSFEGMALVTASVVDEGQGPVGTGKLTLFNAKIKRYGLGTRTELSFQADRKGARWNGFTNLIRGGGVVRLDGHLGFSETLPVDVSAGVEKVSFAKLMEQLGITPNAIVDWDLNGNFKLSGTIHPLRLAGPLHMPTRGFKITQDAWHQAPARHILAVSSARLDGSVGVRPDGIHLERMKASLPRSTLQADVLIGFDNALWVRGEAERIDLSDCTPLLDFSLGGRAKFLVEVDGTMSYPVVRGKLELTDFAFDTYLLGDVQSGFKLEKDSQAVRFVGLKAKKRESRYRTDDLLLDFTEHRFQATAGVAFERMKLADFYHVFHLHEETPYKRYQGVVAGSSKLRYTRSFPGDSPVGTLVADFDLDIPECVFEGVPFENGHVQARWTWRDQRQGYRGGELALEHLSLRKGRGTISASGTMGLGGALEMIAVADHVTLGDLGAFSKRMPELESAFAATGRIRGTLELPRADFELSVSALGWRGKHLGEGRFFVRMTDKQDPWVQAALLWDKDAPPPAEPCAHARLGLASAVWTSSDTDRHPVRGSPSRDVPMAYLICGRGLDGQIDIDLAIGRTDDRQVLGTVEFNRLQIAPFIPQQSRGEPLGGAVSGRVSFVEGSLQHPESLVGNVIVHHFALGRQALSLHNQGPINLTFERGSFYVGNASLNAPSSYLRIGGSGSLEDGLALSVDGDIDLGLLSGFTKSISQIGGRMALKFNVTGPFEKPAVYGHASVRDGQMRFASFPEPVEAFSGEITFSAQRVIFENFSATFAGGRLSASGSAELQPRGVGKYDILIDADNVSIARNGQFEIRFGGQTALRWKQGQRLPILTGTVQIDRMKYKKPIQMGPALNDVYTHRRPFVEPYDPEQDRLELDLQIEQKRSLRIENNLLDADLVIRNSERPFRLVGTDQRFGLLGNLGVKRGVLRFRQTAFDVRQGDITFENPNRIDPLFDVMAVTDIRRTGDLSAVNWRITLQAKGSAESFKLSASSDPYLSEEDIALLLAIGMTRSEVEQSQTNDLAETAALEALSSVTGVDQEVKRVVPAVDDVRLTSAYSDISHRSEPQITVGKRLADRVRLNASTGLAQSRDFKTGVEWQLSDKTSVKAVYNHQNAAKLSQLGDLGLDLTWRLEFK